MLEAAGVAHQVDPAKIDEAAWKPGIADAADVALQLAGAKACDVSARRPGDWVIGSDSVVTAAGRRFDKPSSREEAESHLRQFSGGTIELSSAVALARNGEVGWSHADTARLQVRPLSDGFIAQYLEQEWPAVSHCVGVFRLEGPGVQLFESIEGDHFTILGMPLLPLLGALRERGQLPS